PYPGPAIVERVNVGPVDPKVTDAPARLSYRKAPPAASGAPRRAHANRVPAPSSRSATAASTRALPWSGPWRLTVHVGPDPPHAPPHTPKPDAESGSSVRVTCRP